MEKIINMRRGLALATALLATASCAAPANQVASAPESSVATAAASESPAETAAPSAPTEVNGIPVKGPAQNVHGKYLQTTLSADDPIFNLDMNLVYGDSVYLFTGEEIKEAVRVASIFTAEEGIDSILNGSNDPADVDAWWAANSHKIAPEWQGQFYDYAKAGGKMIVRTPNAREVTDVKHWQAENSPRILSRNNSINKIEIDSMYNNGNSIGVYTNLDYSTRVVGASGAPEVISVKGVASVFLTNKNPSNEWLIEGLHTVMTPQ